MKKTIIAIIAVLIAAIGIYAANPSNVSTIDAVRFNKETKSYESLCTVRYYMRGDTVFVDKQYSFLGIQFSDNDTRSIVQEKALLFKQKGNMWYAVVNRSNTEHVGNSYISAIVFRDCRWNQPQKRQCYDSYLYNVSKCGIRQPHKSDIVSRIISKVN